MVRIQLKSLNNTYVLCCNCACMMCWNIISKTIRMMGVVIRVEGHIKMYYVDDGV